MPTVRRCLNLSIHSSVLHISLPVNGCVFLLVEHWETLCAFLTQQSEQITVAICNESPLFKTVRTVMCL